MKLATDADLMHRYKAQIFCTAANSAAHKTKCLMICFHALESAVGRDEAALRTQLLDKIIAADSLTLGPASAPLATSAICAVLDIPPLAPYLGSSTSAPNDACTWWHADVNNSASEALLLTMQRGERLAARCVCAFSCSKRDKSILYKFP